MGDEVKMVTIMLFGNAKECDIAIKMMDEAMENREQKQKQREREYEKKRDAKNRDRQLYHLRHTNDYEALGIPIGESSTWLFINTGMLTSMQTNQGFALATRRPLSMHMHEAGVKLGPHVRLVIALPNLSMSDYKSSNLQSLFPSLL